MYKGIKSKICINGFSSDLFTCNVGVRQGESLSPCLFSLYINDLEDYLLDKTQLDCLQLLRELKRNFFIFKNVYPVLCRRYCYFS